MYCEHFGLNYPPFKITPDTQLFYPGGKRGLVLEALLYAIKSGEGIVKVVGEVGSGKTMLCRMLEKELPKSVEIVYLANPHLSPDMILHAIAFEMQLPVTPNTNPLEVMHWLQAKLLEKHVANQQVVVFVEEAQAMPLETLEEIRLLSNLETNRHKLLQIVLFGQPELDTNLAAPHIRQLKERITHSFYLTSLTRDDIKEYVHFRMQAVNYRGPPVFSKRAIHILSEVSKGLIRRVNILADKSLLATFAENTHQVQAKHVRLAARDSGFAYRRFTLGTYFGVGILSIAVLALGAWLFVYQQWVWAWFFENTTPSTAITTETLEPLLAQRLQATHRWLSQAQDQHYTIQVLQSKKVEDLSKFLRKSEIQPLVERLYIYRTDSKGQTFWGIVYAEFDDEASANEALTALPESVRRNQPFLRTLANLRDKLSN